MFKATSIARLLLLVLLLPPASAVELEVVAALDQAPGNITVTPDGRILVSMHQFFPGELRVGELGADGALRPFPLPDTVADGVGSDAALDASLDAAIDAVIDPGLDAVLGLQSDRHGVVWMLDNGRRSGVTPRLIGWDTRGNRLYRELPLPPPLTRASSMINDLAVDRSRELVFIADPARGAQAALIVVDLRSGRARRVLEGHVSVVAADVALEIDGRPLRVRTADGRLLTPTVGVNPIALDRDGEWLYFGPMHGTRMYRLATADLLDPELSPAELARRVQDFGERPVSDGISIDHAGNIYISDIGANSIGVLSQDGRYRRLVSDPRLSWPDAFSHGPDGWLYVVANQLQRSARLNAGEDVSRPPFYIMRLRPLAAGTVGR